MTEKIKKRWLCLRHLILRLIYLNFCRNLNTTDLLNVFLLIQGKNSIVHSSTHQSSDEESSDSGHFEKYVMRATRSVDNILALDRVRQEVALRDYTLAQSESNADNVSMISKRNQSQTWSLK